MNIILFFLIFFSDLLYFIYSNQENCYNIYFKLFIYKLKKSDLKLSKKLRIIAINNFFYITALKN